MNTFKETDDVWRLYRREWVTIHTVTRTGDPDARQVFDEARAWIQEELIGRVRTSEINVVLNTDQATAFWAHIEVFKDNLKGEFKHVENAQMFAQMKEYEEFTIVPRNSKEDHAIRSYGVVKL